MWVFHEKGFGNGHFTLAVRTRPRNESLLASHIRESTRARCGLWTMSSGGNGGRPPRAKSNDGGPSNDGGSGQSTPQSSNPPSVGHSRQPSFAPAEDAGVYRRSTSSVDFTDIGSAVAAMPPPPPRPQSRGPSNDSAPQSRPISRTGTETEQLSAMVHVPKGSLEVGNVIVAHDKLATSGVLGVIPGAGAAPTATGWPAMFARIPAIPTRTCSQIVVILASVPLPAPAAAAVLGTIAMMLPKMVPRSSTTGILSRKLFFVPAKGLKGWPRAAARPGRPAVRWRRSVDDSTRRFRRSRAFPAVPACVSLSR